MLFLPGNSQHIGARGSQQDAFAFADPDNADFVAHAGYAAVVCDGMGGMEHGDAASRAAVRAFLEAYSQKQPMESIPAALERSVRATNDHVVSVARSMGMEDGMGTTLVAAVLHNSSLYYVSVGDSGLFHVSGGHVEPINHFHVFAHHLDQAVARGQITKESALAHPERESLTSFIGTGTLAEIDQNLEPRPLQDGDTIILASDGMFKTLEPGEILLSLRGSPEKWPEALVKRTLDKQREFQDNVTVVSMTLESEEHAAARAAMPEPPEDVPMAPPPLPGVAFDASPIPAPPSSGDLGLQPPAQAQPTPPPAPTTPANDRALWLFVSALLVAAAGGAVWLWWNGAGG